MNQLKYQIALTLLPGVGDVLAKSLLAYCGSPEAIFKEKKQNILKIPGIGSKAAASILNQNVFERVEEEIHFIEQNEIKPLFLTDDAYPKRLKHCEDGPILLYFKGNLDFNSNH
ncbi:MAG: helix-hairpin-helix domain-containing protein, partial [Schleiferiaceae bacterium]|nr:helix-hairpin-helix domain-containing protein [Schleiferiaceae bacterium]